MIRCVANPFDREAPKTQDGRQCATLCRAGITASTLLAASPVQARAFAVAMHERSCEAGDDPQSGFWLRVIDHMQPASAFTCAASLEEKAPPAIARMTRVNVAA